MRRDRASRHGAELFLFERTFDECLDRLADVRRRFDKALLIGCPDPEWPVRLGAAGADVDVLDPGPLFAEAAGGRSLIEDREPLPRSTYDLCVAIGTLDTVNDLPLALTSIRQSLRPDSLFIGAFAGGDTLPMLRSAMREADRISGNATPHVHPRIEPAAVAPLLSAAGFEMPVVDVDRVRLSYPSLRALLRDLRRMGATNILSARSRTPLSRADVATAEAAFRSAGEGERTIELVEIIHFAAWTESGR